MWDPAFGAGDEAFDAVRQAADRLRGFASWPTVAEIDHALRDLVPIRFVPQEPKPRRRRGPIAADALYDGMISVHGVVPTRPESWHDLMNALVWASFPAGKRALHARLYRAMRARIGDRTERLPNARTPEQDRLAMLDEGGVLIAAGARFVFGHALLEHRIVSPERSIRPCEIPLDAPDRPAVDAALARWLDEEGLRE